MKAECFLSNRLHWYRSSKMNLRERLMAWLLVVVFFHRRSSSATRSYCMPRSTALSTDRAPDLVRPSRIMDRRCYFYGGLCVSHFGAADRSGRPASDICRHDGWSCISSRWRQCLILVALDSSQPHALLTTYYAITPGSLV
ncbi:unnamed protein product [Amoebophrya sp. A25]|nr:unnamed protein product [Amoebophrya sp. A25]|eukprot:GSA25T00025662001.1